MSAPRSEPAARPMVKLPPPRSPDEVAQLERDRRGAQALAYVAEVGVLEASRRAKLLDESISLTRDELVAALERAVTREPLEDALRAFDRFAATLKGRMPYSVGAVVVCTLCRQVGEAVELVHKRIRWRWPGTDAFGRAVHPVRVIQARDVGDMPPGYCPDHEAEGVRLGVLERRVVVTLERREVRRG